MQNLWNKAIDCIQPSLIKSHLVVEETLMRAYFEEALKELGKRLGSNAKDRETINFLFAYLGSVCKVCGIIQNLYKLAEDIEKEGKKAIYVVSSLFLFECYGYLNKKACVESLHLVSGIRLGNMNVLDRMLKVAMEKQTAFSVSADPLSLRDSLIELENFGHRLLAYFHIHPGMGKHCTFPSYNDLEIQKMLERGKHQTIGAIFSRDGYVRFFPQDKEFEILVYGKGVKKEDDKVFKLIQQVQGSEKLS